MARSCKPPNVEHVPSMPEVEASCQLEHYRTKSTDLPFGYLAAETRDSVKPQVQVASKFCFEKLDSSHSILTLTLYTHEMSRASRENIKRETLEKNKIDSSTIFI